jgi:hypothetical protein
VPQTDRVCSTPRRTASKNESLACPVLPIALRVGELWDAYDAAEERGHGKSGPETCEQIYKLRAAVEETASFERARSLAGALFQVALARDAANHLYELVPPEKRAAEKTFEKLIRLLDSVSLLLRDESTPEEYQAVKDVVGVYLSIDQDYQNLPFQWLDEIPELAKEYRRSNEASTAAALI